MRSERGIGSSIKEVRSHPRGVLGSRVAKRQTAHSTVKGLGNFLIALEP